MPSTHLSLSQTLWFWEASQRFAKLAASRVPADFSMVLLRGSRTSVRSQLGSPWVMEPNCSRLLYWHLEVSFGMAVG
jgi:hypothetical protein